jgi:hypothetical protein
VQPLHVLAKKWGIDQEGVKMPVFVNIDKDNFEYEIDVVSLRRVKKLLGVDLLGLGPEELLTELGSPMFLIDLIYVLCKDDADRKGLNDEEFGAKAVTDALDEHAVTILKGLADFHRRLGKARLARLLLEAAKKAVLMKKRMDEGGEAMDQAIDTALEAEWRRIERDFDRLAARGGKSTSSPESSEGSTPTGQE